MDSAGSLNDTANIQSSASISEFHGNVAGQISETQRVFARQLRLLFDARKIFDGGIGVYIRNCLTGLIFAGCKPTVIISEKDWQKLSYEYPSLNTKLTPCISRASKYSLHEYFSLLNGIDQTNFDLFHSPHFTLPFGLRLPSVVTVHDLIHLTHPEKFYYPWLATPLISHALKKSTHIITVSEASKKQLLNKFNQVIGANKITVTPNVLDELWFQNTKETKVSLNLGKYALAVISNSKPHKGIKDLLLAFKNYKHFQKEKALNLVLAGYAFKNPSWLLKELQELELIDTVHILGPQSNESIRSLYLEACFVICPSLAEGFGIPVLEAQACQKLVVMRPVPALIELHTKNDIIAENFSISALSRAIIEAASKYSQYEKVDNIAQLDRFTQINATNALLKVYQTSLHGVF